MTDKLKIDTIEEAIEDIKNGKVIIVVDDEDRENEG
ncbi:MAG: 3,4-dihydroxy-2-butanone-4-phosphate synthase, partial [Flammeovirgaceae bacterium]